MSDVTIPAPSSFALPTPDALPANHKAVISTKTFDHNLGWSACFRQWRAKSHCRFMHGYALAFKFRFAALTLDERGWVIDFGGLKGLRKLLEDNFDHKTLIADDDPLKDWFLGHHGHSMDVVVVPAVGCEAFARMAYKMATDWLAAEGHAERVWIVDVEVSEHGANSAICQG